MVSLWAGTIRISFIFTLVSNDNFCLLNVMKLLLIVSRGRWNVFKIIINQLWLITTEVPLRLARFTSLREDQLIESDLYDWMHLHFSISCWPLRLMTIFTIFLSSSFVRQSKAYAAKLNFCFRFFFSICDHRQNVNNPKVI